MTSCQTSDKQPQMKMKIGIMININMTKSNMALVFNIINFSLIIHRICGMLSNKYQTTSDKDENWYID